MRGRLLVAGLVILSACSREPVPDPPSPSQTDDVLAFEGDGTPLEPGRYRYEAFEPAMTFEVGPGWLGGHTHAEFYDVQREEGALVGFARPTFVMGRDGPVDVIGLDAREAIRTISSIEEIDADPITETTVDGRPAWEVRTSADASVELFGSDDGTFTAEAGRHRLLGVDVDGILVLVIEHIWADAREPIEPMAQAVIDSVRFESSSGSSVPAAFSSSGCPVDDADACDRLAMAARALTQADATALAGLSRPDRFECDDVPAEIFPACAAGGVLRGHAVASSAPVFEVLAPAAYRSQLEAILGSVDPSFTDDHGTGSIEVLGVGTCGPEELARRSYHLGMTMAVAESGAPPERLLGSFEFVHREGRWWIGVWYLDTLEALTRSSPDPFTTIACGNMLPWG